MDGSFQPPLSRGPGGAGLFPDGLPPRVARRPHRRLNPYRLLAVLLALGLAGAAGYLYFRAMAPLNVLVMGLDNDGTRSDVMILASIDPRHQVVNLISIPRDTRVPIPSRRHPEKITHAHAYGGPELALRVVRNFFGVNVSRYVDFDLKGFAAAVDALGGIDLNVEKRMYYDDPYQNLHIDLRPGPQHLDGNQALQYVRYRDETGDLGRVERQKKFLHALLEQVKRPANLPRLPAMAREASHYVKTNLSPKELLGLAGLAPRLSPEHVVAETVPGQAAVLHDPEGSVWYFVADQQKTKELLGRLIVAR